MSNCWIILYSASCLLLIFTSYAAALSCEPCNKDQCGKPEGCSIGYVREPCNCCLECAKNHNEICGGSFRLQGTCGFGFYCRPSQNISNGESVQRLRESEGTCQPCRSVLYSGCNLLENQCQCGESCTRDFQFSSPELCLLEKNKGTKCLNTVCPDVDHFKHCPSDSIRTRPTLDEQGCCFLEPSCECDNDSCSNPPVCSYGQRSQVTQVGTDQPGKCCPTYECKPVTYASCTVGNQTYNHGSHFTKDKCLNCSCSDGFVICDKTHCEQLACSWQTQPHGECCPQCTGCVSSSSGQRYKNGESWTEQNSCTQCQCVDGQSHCTAAMCQKTCTNPRHVTGLCCPQCDEDEVIYSVAEVTTRHPIQPCSTRSQCQSACVYKEYLTVSACSVCLCLDKDHMCASVTCNKKCLHGFKHDTENDCLLCTCKRCARFSCALVCQYGYEQDEKGCNLCKCKERELDACFKTDGVALRTGDSWFDGCRRCYCEAGREMCSLITCPRLDCSQPIIKSGHCCPSCPSDGDLLPDTVGCLMSDGSVYAEKELWQLDMCTVCMCVRGETLCETNSCPPTLCSHPIKKTGKCCAECPAVSSEENFISSDNIRYESSCTNVYDAVFGHGDTWKVGDCQSCICQHGRISCFAPTCPILSCAKTILRKGQCCAQCTVSGLFDKVCIYNDIWYKHGDEWEDNSAQCECNEGNVRCYVLETSGEQKLVINKSNQINEEVTGRLIEKDYNGMTMSVIIILSVLLLIFAVVVIILLIFLVIIFIHKRKKQKQYLIAAKTAQTPQPELTSINNNKEFVRRAKKPNNLNQAGTERKYNSVIDPIDLECRRSLINPNCLENSDYHSFN